MKFDRYDQIEIRCVWGSTNFDEGFVMIGYFENDAPNWPRIYVTVPLAWEKYAEDNLEEFLKNVALEFVRRYNAGEFDKQNPKAGGSAQL